MFRRAAGWRLVCLTAIFVLAGVNRSDAVIRPGYVNLTLGAVVAGTLELDRSASAPPLLSPPSGAYEFQRAQLSFGAGFGIQVIRPVIAGLMVETGGLGLTYDDWFDDPFESNAGFSAGSLVAKVATPSLHGLALRPGIGFGWITFNPIGLEDEWSGTPTLRYSVDLYNGERLPIGLEFVLLTPFETSNDTYDKIAFKNLFVIRGGIVY